MLENGDINTISALTGFSITAIWATRMLWRRIIKDGTETAKDRAEINIIEVLQSQIATLSAENLKLRTNESELSVRLGRLEAKGKEAENLTLHIEKLSAKLEAKDAKIEGLIKSHAEETAALRALLVVKDTEIKELYERIIELEDRLAKDEKLIQCPHCKKKLGQ